MHYSDEIIDDVRSNSNIVDIIGEHVNLKKNGNNYIGLCPFHNEKTPSFSVNESKQFFYCFGCQKGGSIFTFLMEYEHMTFQESIKYLADRAGMIIPETEMTAEEKKISSIREQIREINHKAVNYYHYCLNKDPDKRGYNYLKDRGVTDDTIKSFGLGYSMVTKNGIYSYLKKQGFDDEAIKASGLVTFDGNGAYDKFFNRVMFPILDYRGKTIGFGGRVMGDGKPKYLNSPETPIFSKRKNLFGMYQARSSKRQGFILCEGYMDVISLHQAGFDNAVASLGTAFTEEQAMILKGRRDDPTIYLAYDSDTAGVNAALKAIDICDNVGLITRVISMKPHKDPDEFIKSEGAEAYEKRIINSEDSIKFRIHVLEDSYNLNEPMEKTKFINICCTYLVGLDGIARDEYEKWLEREYDVSVREIHKKVVKGGEEAERLHNYAEVKKAADEDRKRVTDKAKEGSVVQEKMLLSWVSNHPTVWKKVREYINIEDFTEGLTRQIAEIFERQISENGELNFGELIDSFDDVSIHGEISSIISQPVYQGGEGGEEPNLEDAKRALIDIVRKIKLSSINRALNGSNGNDKPDYNQLGVEKAKASKIVIPLEYTDIK